MVYVLQTSFHFMILIEIKFFYQLTKFLNLFFIQYNKQKYFLIYIIYYNSILNIFL